MPNGGCVGFVEKLKFNAVESDESFLRANPDISVSGLQQGLNTVLGQAIFRTPDRMHILRYWLVGVQTPGGACEV